MKPNKVEIILAGALVFVTMYGLFLTNVYLQERADSRKLRERTAAIVSDVRMYVGDASPVTKMVDSLCEDLARTGDDCDIQ